MVSIKHAIDIDIYIGMKCMSCQEEVSPKFNYAISVNTCPYCGKDIIPVQLQTILNELKTVMDAVGEFKSEVEDWLASNFGLKKIAEDEVVVKQSVLEKMNAVKQHRPPMSINRSSDDDDPNVGVPLPTNPEFAARAGIKTPKALKRAVDLIQNASGAAHPSEFVGVDNEYGDVNLSPNDNVPLNNNEMQTLGNLFSDNKSQSSSQDLELSRLKHLRSQSALSNGNSPFKRE
jgi:DNA-directed RNA polymerase subunit RPC12/RpoP